MGEYAIVREGAVVEQDVPAFTMVSGVPGRVIQELLLQRLGLVFDALGSV